MDDENRVYAPIAIITCNRYEHFRACIESLQKNTLAVKTEIFIGLDYPPSCEYEAGYHKIEDYLSRGIDGFKKVNVLKREYNFGVEQNLFNLLDLIMQKYDRWIFTEDDNVFAMDFLDYINYYLELYKDDTKVNSICGHTLPQEELYLQGKEGYIFARHGYSAWGVANWRDKWQESINAISKEWMEDMVKRSNSYTMPRRMRYKFVGCFLTDDWGFRDTTLSFYLWFCRKYQIFPRNTKVKNNGFDGTGVHAIADEKRNEGVFEEGVEYFAAKKADSMYRVVEDDYNSMFAPHDFSVRLEIIYFVMRLLGFKGARHVSNWLGMIK